MKIDLANIKMVRDPEMTWLNANRQRLEKLYPGQWVAIKGSEVVGHGTMEEAGRMAAAKGIDRPLFTAFRRFEDHGKVFLGAHRRA
jgi:hypothetical protein